MQENSTSFLELKGQLDGSDKINVTCKTKIAGETTLIVALIQLHASTDVKRGENKGVLLHHINIVRDLKSISDDKKTNNNFFLLSQKAFLQKI